MDFLFIHCTPLIVSNTANNNQQQQKNMENINFVTMLQSVNKLKGTKTEVNNTKSPKIYLQLGVFFTYTSEKYGESIGKISGSVANGSTPKVLQVVIIQKHNKKPFVFELTPIVEESMIALLDKIKPKEGSFDLKESLFNLHATAFKTRLETMYKDNPSVLAFFDENSTLGLSALKPIVKQRISDIRFDATALATVYRAKVKEASTPTVVPIVTNNNLAGGGLPSNLQKPTSKNGKSKGKGSGKKGGASDFVPFDGTKSNI